MPNNYLWHLAEHLQIVFRFFFLICTKRTAGSLEARPDFDTSALSVLLCKAC